MFDFVVFLRIFFLLFSVFFIPYTFKLLYSWFICFRVGVSD